jgi:hypothetical protein
LHTATVSAPLLYFCNARSSCSIVCWLAASKLLPFAEIWLEQLVHKAFDYPISRVNGLRPAIPAQIVVKLTESNRAYDQGMCT